MINTLICGVDEVGRGSIAGPVLASAVVFPLEYFIPNVRDSKQINPKERKELSRIITQKAVAIGHGWVDHRQIDTINIHYASLLAMIRAIDNALYSLFEAGYTSDLFNHLKILVDGKYLPRIDNSQYSEHLRLCEIEAIIQGDTKVFHISAASIVAKVLRDEWMIAYNNKEPQYGFAQHKGYPTPAHKKAIHEHGPSKIQRLSFLRK